MPEDPRTVDKTILEKDAELRPLPRDISASFVSPVTVSLSFPLPKRIRLFVSVTIETVSFKSKVEMVEF
jgi:hypothetical protein